MSDNRTAIYCDFINRRTGGRISQVPLVNRISINKDITQFSDTFDFDVMFRRGEKIDLRSHDFVEFYFILNGQKWQIFAGFIQTMVKSTGNNSLQFQANGTNFLGQFLNLPFLNAKPIDTTTLLSFCQKIVDQTYISNGDPNGTYLKEYLTLKRVTRTVVDSSAYQGTVNVPELSDSKIAPILQSVAEEVINIVYQNRFGQMVVWGRGDNGQNVSTNDTGLWLTDMGDTNVNDFQLREDFARVFSECKIQYVGGEGNIDYYSTPSNAVFNSHPKAKQIFNPEVRTFQTGTLVTTAGSIGVDAKRDQLAASILRKSNQNIARVVIKTNNPYYITQTGDKIPYDTNQIWGIKSEEHGLSEKMRLIGIGYSQQSDALNVELCFVPKDSLI